MSVQLRGRHGRAAIPVRIRCGVSVV